LLLGCEALVLHGLGKTLSKCSRLLLNETRWVGYVPGLVVLEEERLSRLCQASDSGGSEFSCLFRVEGLGRFFPARVRAYLGSIAKVLHGLGKALGAGRVESLRAGWKVALSGVGAFSSDFFTVSGSINGEGKSVGVASAGFHSLAWHCASNREEIEFLTTTSEHWRIAVGKSPSSIQKREIYSYELWTMSRKGAMRQRH